MDTQASFQSSRLQIQAIHNSVEKLKDILDRMTARVLGWLNILTSKLNILVRATIKCNVRILNFYWKL